MIAAKKALDFAAFASFGGAVSHAANTIWIAEGTDTHGRTLRYTKFQTEIAGHVNTLNDETKSAEKQKAALDQLYLLCSNPEAVTTQPYQEIPVGRKQ